MNIAGDFLAFLRERQGGTRYVRAFARRRPEVEVAVLRFTNFIGPRIDSLLTHFLRMPVVPTALGYDAASGRATFVQRNKVTEGETVELISPGTVGRAFAACALCDEAGAPIESAPHPGMIFSLRVPFAVRAGDILRGSN